MKRLLFFIVLLGAVNTATIAQVSDDTYLNIATESNEKNVAREIPLSLEKPGNGPRTRGVNIQPVYAYLYNKMVNVQFTEMFSTVTVIILNETTGESAYFETYSSPSSFNIDLNKESSGEYRIEIEIGDTYLEGSFSL